jgi:hypothetical protein
MSTRPGNRLGVTDADLGIWPLLWVRQGKAGRTAREAITEDAVGHARPRQPRRSVRPHRRRARRPAHRARRAGPRVDRGRRRGHRARAQRRGHRPGRHRGPLGRPRSSCATAACAPRPASIRPPRPGCNRRSLAPATRSTKPPRTRLRCTAPNMGGQVLGQELGRPPGLEGRGWKSLGTNTNPSRLARTLAALGFERRSA